MKIKSKILILFFLVAGFSCSLDEIIYDTPITSNSLQSDTDIDFRIAAVYGYLQGYNAFKSNLHYQIIYGGDEIASNHSVGREFVNRTVATTNAYHATPWRAFYNAIVNANYLISDLESIENPKLTNTGKNKGIGEAQFLRAFTYFYLVRLYGGVPVVSAQGTTGTSDFYLPRKSVDEVYRDIFTDFKSASAKLQLYTRQSSSERGRATKGSAQAMLSLAYLTYANYLDLNGKSSDATNNYLLSKTYADSVILSNQYNLLNNYADLFDVNKEAGAYNEVIFAIQQTRDTKTADASSKGSELPWASQPVTRYYVCGQTSAFGKGASSFFIQPWFYDVCTTGDYINDYRSQVAFLTRWTENAGPKERITYPEVRKTTTSNESVEGFPYLNKYVDPKGLQTRNNENDFFIIRLAEVYLIKAEAENELKGPTVDAYAAFNMLRARARLANGSSRTMPADLTPGLSKEDFRMKIFDERGLELVGEGHRWFDAVRMRCKDNTRTMVQYIHEDILDKLPLLAPSYDVTTKVWGGGRVYPTNLAKFSGKFLIWPIPSQEVDANPSMAGQQNPGW
jgi:hypothetical protein